MTHFYEIRIAGHLDDHWADWFDGWTVTQKKDGTTLLSGPVPDQPALYGLLRKVRDLGLPLVSANQITVTLRQQILNKKRSNTKMNANTTKRLEMKAIVFNQYGTPDVLKLANVPAPTPKDDQVLIRVFAASVNSADYRLLSGPIPRLMGFGLCRPNNKIMGADIAGRIEAVGKNVSRFKPGDEVFADISTGFGGFAEYVCARESILVKKPANLTFEQAAAVPMAAVTALQGLRKGGIQPGNRVAIVGASGGVGTFMVQIAKSFGVEVTAISSTKKMEGLRALGADHVIDYTREVFTRSGQRYDLILAVNGYRPLADYRRALKPQGTYVMVGGEGRQISESLMMGPLVSRRGGQTMTYLAATPNADDLSFVKDLIEAGKVAPVIDRTHPLENTAEAVRHIGAGHAAGKVIIRIKETL
jgi:NADPH:quinone reductase-like Zn-dependent oxidoreductase